MNSKLIDNLKCILEPVAIYFTDTKPENALQFEKDKRGCVASMMIAAGNGKVAVFDEDTYGCGGGGVGLCFGNGFMKKGLPAESLLSTGDAALASQGKSFDRSLGIGERFFESPRLASEWLESLPYTELPEKYVVFKPFSMVDERTIPDLLMFFVNPDQLSTLVYLTGFRRGQGINAIAPFAAACQSIMYAYQEMKQPCPKAIMGFFDIAQRHKIAKELISYTVPYHLFQEMDQSVDESFMITDTWKKIAAREV